MTNRQHHTSDHHGQAPWHDIPEGLVEFLERESPLSAAAGHDVTTSPLGSFEADVAVIGGGSAGLAAAVVLARSRRTVVVVDGGQPRNAPAEGAHNVLGQEGIPPLELLAKGRAEAESYGVKIVPGYATAITGSIDDFTVDVGGGTHQVRARRIILATGLEDDLPDIPGVAEGWGRSVLHCPFCHGWEVRDQRIAILTRDVVAMHQAMLFRRLSDQVTVFLHDAPDPSIEQREQLAALDVTVIRPRVEHLIMDGAQVRGVATEDGHVFDADAAVVVPRFNARTALYESLGGHAEASPFGMQIPTDPRGMTSVPGVWAAGNANNPMAMVVAAAASGVATGAAVHGDLCTADLDRATQERRTPDKLVIEGNTR
ncbi:MAG TPA: NAD(P)/FAD-dependent oxidoreductase [Arachnia sp.]|nr:NAD(P)/FAD-dependent oxidoreductase [Arachnia sp.]HMT85389.1 NAD(P)/FAD-dependent oxidoreductase [Arachnia sp.]